MDAHQKGGFDLIDTDELTQLKTSTTLPIVVDGAVREGHPDFQELTAREGVVEEDDMSEGSTHLLGISYPKVMLTIKKAPLISPIDIALAQFDTLESILTRGNIDADELEKARVYLTITLPCYTSLPLYRPTPAATKYCQPWKTRTPSRETK